MKVEIYTLPGCDWCEYAMDWFENQSIVFNETVVNYAHKKQMCAMLTERSKTRITTFPQIFIDGVYIGGHSDLIDKKNKILELHKKELNGDKNILKNGLYLLSKS